MNDITDTASPAADPYAPQRFTLEITFRPGRGWTAAFADPDAAGKPDGADFTAGNPAALLAEVTKVLRPLHRTPWQVFKTAHGDMTVRALRWFAVYMREAAANAQGAYETVSADPELAAKQDQTMMTTVGLYQSGQAFTQSAEQADRVREAFGQLNGDREYELEEFASRHGHVLTNALMVMTEHIREGKDAEPPGDLADADAAEKARDGYLLLTGELDDEDEPLDAGFQE